MHLGASHFLTARIPLTPPARPKPIGRVLPFVGRRGACLFVGQRYRAAMELTLPRSLSERLSPQDAALLLAIGLFVTEEATLGQAAEVAGLSQAAFLRELGKRRIPVHYGEAELAEDLRAVESLSA